MSNLALFKTVKGPQNILREFLKIDKKWLVVHLKKNSKKMLKIHTIQAFSDIPSLCKN